MDFPANEIMRAHMVCPLPFPSPCCSLAGDPTRYALMQVQFEQHMSGHSAGESFFWGVLVREGILWNIYIRIVDEYYC